MSTIHFSEQVGSLRRTLRRALNHRVAQQSARPVAQLQALRLIARGEVHTQADLAQRVLIDPPAASRLVATLQRAGLLKQLPGADRRCVQLKVTPRARTEVAVMNEAMAWLNLQVRQHLSQREVEAGYALMRKLQRGLTEADGLSSRAP